MSKTIKMPLAGFLLPGPIASTFSAKLAECLPPFNDLIVETYHLLALHFRRLLESSLPIPTINQKLILQFTKALIASKGKVSPAVALTKSTLWDPLRLAAALPLTLSRPTCIDQCVKYAATEMVTTLCNNIALHFSSRVRAHFLRLRPNLTKQAVQKRLAKWWDSGTSTSFLHLFPDPHALNPDVVGKSVPYLLKAVPHLFIRPMWYMLKSLEEHNANHPENPLKLFSLLPLRTGFQIHHIPIDSETLRQWLPTNKDYNKMLYEGRVTNAAKVAAFLKQQSSSSSDAAPKRLRRKKSEMTQERELLWNDLVNRKALRGLGKYHFAHRISTDGVSVSIYCVKNLAEEVQPKKKARIKSVKREEEVSLLHTLYSNRKVVGVDPGVRSILYMTTDSGEAKPKETERLEYTGRQRAAELNTKRHAAFTQQRKEQWVKNKKIDIVAMERELSTCNSKASSLEEFERYLRTRYKHQTALKQFYENKVFRRMRFTAYRLKQQSEEALVRRIEEKFGGRDEIVLAYGNWSRKTAMKGCQPAAVVGIRRRLERSFDVMVVDEYKTTKTCAHCGGENGAAVERAIRKECKDGVTRKFPNRGLRRCQNEECGILWGRDYGAAINIAAQGKHLQRTGQPHPWFARPTTFQDPPPENSAII